MPSNRATRVVAVAYLGLTACASTNIELQVPQSELQDFLTCAANPASSYKRVTAPTVAIFGTNGQAALTEATAGAQLFITNDQVPAAKSVPAPDRRWAAALATSFHATAAELESVADQVDQLWDHPVHQHFLNAFNELATPTDKNATPAASLSTGALLQYMRLVRSVSAQDGWATFAAKYAAQYQAFSVVSADALIPEQRAQLPKLRQLAAQKFIGGLYISTYLKWYFRNGEFTQLTWDLGNPLTDLEHLANLSSPSDQATINDILTKLKAVDPNASSKLDSIINKNLTGSIGKIGAAGLITRGGDSLAMPAITISANVTTTKAKVITGTKVDANAVLEDVVRVTFEALFDSLNQIPAVSKATGVTELPKDVALADFAKVTSAYAGRTTVMTDASFAAVDADGAKVHAMTASAAATLIRGASIAALNNEAVANTLTTMAGTTARKVTERVVWCYYAVIDPKALPQVDDTGPRSSKTVAFPLKY
jgi:hypothetical protein